MLRHEAMLYFISVMEFAAGYEESSMRFCVLSTDADSGEIFTWDEMKSMGQDSDGSKMSEEDEDSLQFSLRKEAVTSAGVAKLRDEGEVSEADIDRNLSPSLKRLHKEFHDEYSVSTDLKKKRNVPASPDDEFASAVAYSEGGNMMDDVDVMMLDPDVSMTEECRHIKNEEPLHRMLDWLTGVAKDPCHPAVDSLPERSKWKSHGNEESWKQVLLARAAISLKRHDDVATEQSYWQKIQKMHPMMYEDYSGTSYKFRDRIRGKARSSSGKWLSSGKAYSESFSSGAQSNLEKSSSPHALRTEDYSDGNGTSDSSTSDSTFCMRVQQKVPVGPQFQAEVLAWDGVAYESDSKWLGTRIWPLEKTEHRSIIERDPIGKGRGDSCGCQLRGSLDCIRFHIAEKRMRLMVELGSAFYRLKLDKMGEEVGLSWTDEEQNKFATIVKSNPASQDKCFWDQMLESFSHKSREELVSYYFNVFFLRRRASQNRFAQDKIDSDDDESDYSFAVKRIDNREIKPSSPIFYSPTKPNTKFG